MGQGETYERIVDEVQFFRISMKVLCCWGKVFLVRLNAEEKGALVSP